MFDMTELFDWTFKQFPKLRSVICLIKHASNFALEHVLGMLVAQCNALQLCVKIPAWVLKATWLTLKRCG